MSAVRLSTVLAAVVALALPAASAAAASHASYHTPGYRGTHRVPPVAARPPAPLTIGRGESPSILVDAAGTAHIVWNEPVPGQADQLHYCRLPRGATACAVSKVLGIDQPDTLGNSPDTNHDPEGPRVLSVGNELLVLSNRSPNVVAEPGCSDPDPGNCPTSDSNDYLFTSEDGGASFGGPGLIGTNPVGFGAVTFGSTSPFIATLASEPGQGLTFQATHAGQFANDTVSFGDAAAGGNGSCCLLAVDTATRHPVVALSRGGHVVVREWDGAGSPNDPAHWSTSPSFPGSGQPAIATGPSGVFVASAACDSCDRTAVRRVATGVVGPPLTLGPAANQFNLSEDPSGALEAVYATDSPRRELLVRTARHGVHFTAPHVVARSGSAELDNPRLAAAADGGGAVVWQAAGKIEVAGFGATAPTGQPGLGNLPGGSGPVGGDGGSTSCTNVHMGDIDALSEAGCFLRDPQHPHSGAAVTDGELRLNGLQIIPDAGVRVVIDPHARTIDTTGNVAVVLRGLGIGDIPLWHGELHVKLASAAAGQILFDFNTSQFAAALKGFPVDGKIDVILEPDAVKIPISLRLPPYLGGVTGQATLLANNRDGLVLDSMQIGVPDVILGALEIKDLSVSYTREGDVWTGGAKFNIPPHTGEFAIDVQVRFEHGELTMGSFGFGFYPGVPVFTDLYLNHFGGGFDLHPPKRIFGDVSVGAIPLDPPNYAVNVDGTFSITFGSGGSPTIIEVGGTGAVHGDDIANAKLLFQTDGRFEADGDIDINLGVIEVQGGLKAFADLPAKLFSGDVNGTVTVGGVPLASAEALVGNRGTGACGNLEIPPFPAVAGGFFWSWGTSADDVHFSVGSCDLSQYKVMPVSAAAAGVRGHLAAAGSFTVAPGAPLEDIELLGAGGTPAVVLTSPDGRQIVPSAGDVHAPVYAVAFPSAARTVVVLNHPQPGTWTLTPAAGSASIRQARAAVGLPAPRIHAALRGTGRQRELRYRVRGLGHGVTVAFAEQAGRVFRVLGRARAARGSIRFTPADGPRGSRAILALVTVDGQPRTRQIVGRYSAPSPVRPGRVLGLHVTRRRGIFAASFRGARFASRYLVRIDASDGRHLEELIPARRHGLRIPVVGYADRVRVTVTGGSASGRTGPAARGRA